MSSCSPEMPDRTLPVTADERQEVRKNPANIRNIAVLGHANVGKSTLSDLLDASAGTADDSRHAQSGAGSSRDSSVSNELPAGGWGALAQDLIASIVAAATASALRARAVCKHWRSALERGKGRSPCIALFFDSAGGRFLVNLVGAMDLPSLRSPPARVLPLRQGP